MSNPTFCFKNFINFFDPTAKVAPTLTATTEATNYPIENISNWRLDGESRWKANSKDLQSIEADFGGDTPTPDTLIIAGHNSGSSAATTRARFVLDQSDDGAAWTEVVSATQAPDNHPYMVTFTGSAHQYWRIEFDAVTSGAIELGHWFLGQRLDLPVGLQPGIDYHSAATAFYNNSPAHGSYIGRAVSHLNKSIRIDYPSPGFDTTTTTGQREEFFNYSIGTTEYDEQFIQHLAEGFPFWFSPDNDNETDELYYMWADGFSTPFDGSMLRRTFSGTMTGFREVF